MQVNDEYIDRDLGENGAEHEKGEGKCLLPCSFTTSI